MCVCMEAHEHETVPVELACRTSNGIEVALLLIGERLAVTVLDWTCGDCFELDVEAGYAMDAFHHPYAYAAHRGILYGLRELVPVG
jgi:hypothetical protein